MERKNTSESLFADDGAGDGELTIGYGVIADVLLGTNVSVNVGIAVEVELEIGSDVQEVNRPIKSKALIKDP